MFFLFSERALVDRWTDADAESWFAWHINTLRRKCDRDENTTLTVTILMWNVLRKVLDMATENRDNPDPRGHFWFFKDPVGLELWPYKIICVLVKCPLFPASRPSAALLGLTRPLRARRPASPHPPLSQRYKDLHPSLFSHFPLHLSSTSPCRPPLLLALQGSA